MERLLFFVIGLCAAPVFAAPSSSTNDSVVVALSVPGAKRIIATSYGYRLETVKNSLPDGNGLLCRGRQQRPAITPVGSQLRWVGDGLSS